MTIQPLINISGALRRMSLSTEATTRVLHTLAHVVAVNREHWLCEGEGQWPDKFILLNRYVRTDLEPPFIFNN